MSGSWHTYRAGERWQRPRRQMVVTVASARRRSRLLRRPDRRTARSRPRSHAILGSTPSAPICACPILTSTRVERGASSCGCHRHRSASCCWTRPSRRASATSTRARRCGLGRSIHRPRSRPLDAATRRALYRTASDQLRANLGRRGPRRTVPQGLAVYDRAGLPCRRCGTPIRTRRQGSTARSTWWCPACQT